MPNIKRKRGHETLVSVRRFTISVVIGIFALPSASSAQEDFRPFGGFFGGYSDGPSEPSWARPVARPALRPRSAIRPYRHYGLAAHHQRDDQNEKGPIKHAVSIDTLSAHLAVCVRLCDGRYFLLPRSTTEQATTICTAACPAAKTSVFRADGELKDATDADGRTYSALPTAFAFRSRTVPGCSCKGEDKLGMASVPVDKDPTLEQGDIVVTQHGELVVQGKSGEEQPTFTAVEK
jgi:hypothetical protein